MRGDPADILGRPMTEWWFRRSRLMVRYWTRESWRPYAFYAYGMLCFGAFGHCFQVMRTLKHGAP